jgi:predicted metal-dependent peptidase
MTKIPTYLTKGLSALMASDPFHSAMLVHIDLIEIDDVTQEVTDPFLSRIKTAATNGINKIWYSRKWMEPMPIGCQAAVMAHEVQHIVRLHLGAKRDNACARVVHANLTEQGKATLWNVACVAEDEQVLMADGTLKKIQDMRGGDLIATMFGGTACVYGLVTSGYKSIVNISTEAGTLRCSPDHEVLTYEGFKRAEDVKTSDLIAVDSRYGKVLDGQLQSRGQQTAGRALGPILPTGGQQKVPHGSTASVHSGGTESTPEATDVDAVGFQADGLGILSWAYRWGRHCDSSRAQSECDTILPSARVADQYLPFHAEMVPRTRSGDENSQEQGGELPFRDVVSQGQHTRSSEWRNAILDDEETARGVSARMAETSRTSRASLYSDARAGKSLGGNKAVEFARPKSITTEVRGFCYDLVTSDHHYVVGGIVTHNCDAVINKSLHDMGYPISDVIPDTTGVTLDDYKKWLSGQPMHATGSILDLKVKPSDDTIDIFVDLVNHLLTNPPPPPSGSGSSSGEGGLGGGQPDPNGQGQDLSEEAYEKELEAAGLTPDQAEAIVQAAVVAAVTSARERGSLPGYVAGIVEDLNKPFNNWRQTLRRFLRHQSREDFSFRRVSRRTAGDVGDESDLRVVRPALFSEKLGEIVCIVDESGSVSDAELQQGLAEVSDMSRTLKPTGITVITCDTRVTSTTRFKAGEKVVIKTGGRGGTDMKPAFEWAKDNVRDAVCIICFTDGELDFYTKAIAKVPVVWAICNPNMTNNKFKAPWGVTISIEVESAK